MIETAYGPELGHVISSGKARPLAGEPQCLGGRGRERFIYAPSAGTFDTHLVIGTQVHAGQPVGSIDQCAAFAPLSGWLRGLAHDGAEVELGAKIVEIDASITSEAVYRIGERPQRVAAGVLVALDRHR